MVPRAVPIWITGMLAIGLSLISGPVSAEDKAMSAGILVPFEASPFPYDGIVPGDGTKPDMPFLQADSNGRRFHDSPRGGKLYEDQTYNDRRSLLVVPPRFDPHLPGAAIVLFFHGNLATLSAVVAQQAVPRQLVGSGLDAALVAPQLAVAALDSSAGRFYQPGFFATYMHEAAVHLAAHSDGRFTTSDLDALPVVIAAFSGGYMPTAYCLRDAGMSAHSRIAGVILLDAVFAEEQKFEDWIVTRGDSAFFVSAYSKASAPLNRQLEENLRARGLRPATTVPPTIGRGTLVFRASLDSTHADFVTQAWVADPLKDLLRRIRLER